MLEYKVGALDAKVESLDAKVDAVATDLKAHRADTAHSSEIGHAFQSKSAGYSSGSRPPVGA